MISEAAKRVMAQWRREGHGIWYITFVIEGYDEEFTHMVPGSLTEPNAVGLARMQCAEATKEKKKHIHVARTRKET